MFKCYERTLGSIPSLSDEQWISTSAPGEYCSCEARGTRAPLTCSAEAVSFATTTWMLEQGPRLLLPTRKPWTVWTVSPLTDEMKCWNQSMWRGGRAQTLPVLCHGIHQLKSSSSGLIIWPRISLLKCFTQTLLIKKDWVQIAGKTTTTANSKWSETVLSRLGASLWERQGLS